VFSTLTKPSTVRDKIPTVFDPAKSKTWKWPGRWERLSTAPFLRRREKQRFSVEYGTGFSVAGLVGYDTVEIGGFTIIQQAVQLIEAVRETEFEAVAQYDGILGLAFGHLNSVFPGCVHTPLESMIAQNLLQEQLFTVSLGKDPFVTFGFVENASGRDIHWVDVDSRGGFWEFPSETVKIGNQHLRRTGGKAIADTGSGVILTHPRLVRSIYEQIDGADYDSRQPGWIYPIDAVVPEVAFSVGTDDSCMVVISKEDMVYGAVGSGYVFGVIQENPAYNSGGLGFDVFGTPFFHQLYAIFDVKGERLGVILNQD